VENWSYISATTEAGIAWRLYISIPNNQKEEKGDKDGNIH
jgi:hypothetical protein